MISKNFSKKDGSHRRRKSIMKSKTLVQLATGWPLILIFIAACGGGGINTDFSVNNDGFDFKAAEPKYFADETYVKKLPLAGNIRIRLEGINGNIEIEGLDDIDFITVVGRKWAGSDSLQDAEVQLKRLEIQVTNNNDEILVQTLQPGYRQGRQYTVDYEITVPSDLEVEVNLENGDVDVQGVQNSVLVNAVNGEVFIWDITGSAVVALVNGSINSSVTLFPNDEIRLSTENGNVDLSIPTSTSAIFEAYAGSGSITTSNLELVASAQNSDSLTGTLGDGEGVIEVDTVNGNIRVVGFN